MVIGYGLQILVCECPHNTHSELLTHFNCSGTDISLGLGISKFDQELTSYKDYALTWFYVAIAIFSFLFTVLLFILFTGEAVVFKKNGELKKSC